METWTDLCRCCLSANSPVSLFDDENNVKQKFYEITTVEVKPDDGLPQKLCDDCVSTLNTAHTFRQQCVKMDTELKLQLSAFLSQCSESHLEKLDSIIKQEKLDIEFANNPMKQLEDIIKKERMDSDDDTYYVLVIDNPKDKAITDDPGTATMGMIADTGPTFIENPETSIQIQNSVPDSYDNADNQEMEFDESTIESFILSSNMAQNVPETILGSEEQNYENTMGTHISDSITEPQIIINTQNETANITTDTVGINNITDENTLIKILATSNGDGTMLLKTEGMQYLTDRQFINEDGSQEVILCEGDESSQFQILKYDGSELVIEYADEGQIGQYLQSQNIFVCDCGEQFTDANEYETHKVKHNPGGEHLCTMCGKGFESAEILTGHVVLHNVSGLLLNCPFCNQLMKRSMLTQHIKFSHSNIKPQCEICTKTFANPNNLKRHMMIHSGIKDFECDICFKRFNQKITMQTHRLTHVDPLSCKDCDVTFETQEELTKHKDTEECFNNIEKTTQTKQEIIKTVKKEVTTSLGKLLGYACSLCKKMFSVEAALERHIELVHIIETNKLYCNECGDVLGSKKELQHHMLTQHKRKHVKYFECSVCGKGCPSQAMLLMHERVHTNERPFACQLCPLKFKTKTHLRTHQLTHTREKKFGCSVCMKFFALKGNLVVHLRTHTGERPYVCQVCGDAFIDSKYLKKHKLRKHGLGNGSAREPVLVDYKSSDDLTNFKEIN